MERDYAQTPGAGQAAEESMVHWLCRWEQDDCSPALQAQRARELGITGWLFELRWHPGEPLPMPTALHWLANQEDPALGYGLQWRLKGPLSPAGERQAVAELLPWLSRPAALLHGRPLLVLADLKQLSSARFGLERLRQGLNRGLRQAGGPSVLLLGVDAPPGTAALTGLDGRLQGLDPEDCCQRVGDRWNYESHLARAHWQQPMQPPLHLAVQALRADAEEGYLHANAEAYGEWLLQSQAWSRLAGLGGSRSADAPAWLLLESWQGHQRWWPADQTTEAKAITPDISAGPGQDGIKHRWGSADGGKPAVLVHGFHHELLGDLLAALPSQVRQDWTLYLSTPAGGEAAVMELLQSQGWQRVVLATCANRGRDMAPFLQWLLPAAIEAGHPWALKLHTKQSGHLADGRAWAHHLMSTLVGSTNLHALAEAFQQTPQLGLVAPPGCLLPVGLHLDENGFWLEKLARKHDLSGAWLLAQSFPAGSMYAFRPIALEALLNWLPPPQAFETEQGQRDGSLAHALERLVGAACIQGNWDLRELEGPRSGVPQFGHRHALPIGIEGTFVPPC